MQWFNTHTRARARTQTNTHAHNYVFSLYLYKSTMWLRPSWLKLLIWTSFTSSQLGLLTYLWRVGGLCGATGLCWPWLPKWVSLHLISSSGRLACNYLHDGSIPRAVTEQRSVLKHFQSHSCLVFATLVKQDKFVARKNQCIRGYAGALIQGDVNKFRNYYCNSVPYMIHK